MKKIISVLSVLALVGMPTTTAFADSITQDTTGSSGTTSVSYDIAPSYAVVIPSGISLDSSQTVEIKMTGLTDTEKPKLEYDQTVSVSLSNAKNGFSGSDGKTLSLKSGMDSIHYTITGANGKTGKGDVVAKFKYDPNKTLNDYKQTLTFALTSTVQYAGNYTDQLTFTISDGKVDISKLTGAYQAQDGDILTGKGNADTHITVADGATVTLRDCDITAITDDGYHKWAGITLEGDGTLILEGTNKVKGGYDEYPGIYVPENKTLTIKGIGSLEAGSNGWSPAIGGGYKISCGNITILDGTVTANGGKDGAGIGGGTSSSCGNITISGGTVTANGGQWSSGIGSGYGAESSCGNITITGGIVTANGGGDGGAAIGTGVEGSTCRDITISGGIVTANAGIGCAGIGAGEYNCSCGNITISGGIVTANGGDQAAGIGSGYYDSECSDITIKNTVTKVEATKGANAPNSIGAGNYSSCGTVTIEDGANVTQK